MRPLDDNEMKIFFEKLTEYIGENVTKLIDRSDEPYCFRLVNQHVYYVSEYLLKLATNISRDQLLALGTNFGKFTKSGRFRLGITCLDYLAQYATHKVWIKAGAEQSFLYGNHVLKSGLARITDGIGRNNGVIVFNMDNFPLGFGVATQPSEYIRDLDPNAYVVLRQSDLGEYLRDESEIS